jgi:hypothetical protein
MRVTNYVNEVHSLFSVPLLLAPPVNRGDVPSGVLAAFTDSRGVRHANLVY